MNSEPFMKPNKRYLTRDGRQIRCIDYRRPASLNDGPVFAFCEFLTGGQIATKLWLELDGSFGFNDMKYLDAVKELDP